MGKRILILHRDGGGIDIFTRLSPREFVESLDREDVTGYFGTYPDMEQIDKVKGQLYVLGEEGARIHLGEKTFYLRFGLSVLVFLALFYFLVYLVPDPIPLVDELAIALGAAALFSLWHRRRTERGNRMVQKRIDVKGSIDRIEFKESLFLKEMELYLETLDARPLEKIRERWDREPLRLNAEDTTGVTAEILKGIEMRLGRKNLVRFGRMIKKKNGKISDAVINRTVSDIPLALLYHKCREALGQ